MGLRRDWLARHGTARGVGMFGSPGVGVFGSPGFAQNTAGLVEVYSHHDRLNEWLGDPDAPLSYDAEGLARVEARIDGWRSDPLIRPQLDNEVGTYLGAVIVTSVPGCVWMVWPNGHPVVAVAGGRAIDVVALASERAASGTPSLTSVLETAGGYGLVSRCSRECQHDRMTFSVVFSSRQWRSWRRRR